ncbi:hypothetical protein [Pelagicoccus albus]|uniref:Outer membrane protein beta-barrel domain-containing protein n=1 Tax=Pelagicoccus albus TaxID=415222 RepID=A0A7X1B8A8_9BACT|nr:hypothetical protein [Pelagicoccus albus]MBC2607526.1 hypothetical protein [Pelagicoccus albus]
MKTTFALLALSLTAVADASDWQIGCETSFARISGTPIYDDRADYTRELSRDFLVPSLILSKDMGENGTLALRFTYYDEILSEAIDLATDPDSGSEIILPAFSKTIAKDEMKEFSLGYLFTLISTDRATFRLGPELSYFHTRTLFIDPNGEDLLFTNEDLRLGAEAKVSFNLTKKLEASVSYRYTNPPDREIHMITLGLGITL